ncbi:hypothetical protein DUNSADRAFT_17994 [Dunaliella salina]|uniref:Uncharacterized protein n=1 Tax=Dunaliella salina TaxID=3046 RepID=A0ABQ7G0V6_DUNSA|nr:hypothetical protein DUNSADRAFT_17994 [Dunaliella salina]|eukprot:KAF5828237.1 hypothetical protein DUNSADRAFT_17994 [Dunaliella salina]
MLAGLWRTLPPPPNARAGCSLSKNVSVGSVHAVGPPRTPAAFAPLFQSRHQRRSRRRAVRPAAAQHWPPNMPPPTSSKAGSDAGSGLHSTSNGTGASTQPQPGTGDGSAQGGGGGEQVDGWTPGFDGDYDAYYDGSDWGEPEPIRDWGEGPWRPDAYSSWGDQGYDLGYGAYPSGPPPPPPPPPGAFPSSTGAAFDGSGARNGGSAYEGNGYTADPPSAGSDYYAQEEEASRRRESGGEASSSSRGRPFLSDITLLTREEMEMLMPIPPTRSQTNFYQPKSIQERLVQIASSVGVSLALSKSAVLAAPVLLYPIWSPWVKAGCKNLEVYTKQLRCLGLWRAQVIEVQVFGGSPFTAGAWAFGGRSSRASAPTVRVLIGDGWPSGARVQLEFPYTFRSELLSPGEPVEALVLARDATFSAFKVIREVYAPGLGLWLSDYPFIDKSAFLDVSLQIENERQADAERTVDIEAVWEDEQSSAGEPGPSEGAPAQDSFSQRSSRTGAASS